MCEAMLFFTKRKVWTSEPLKSYSKGNEVCNLNSHCYIRCRLSRFNYICWDSFTCLIGLVLSRQCLAATKVSSNVVSRHATLGLNSVPPLLAPISCARLIRLSRLEPSVRVTRSSIIWFALTEQLWSPPIAKSKTSKRNLFEGLER